MTVMKRQRLFSRICSGRVSSFFLLFYLQRPVPKQTHYDSPQYHRGREDTEEISSQPFTPPTTPSPSRAPGKMLNNDVSAFLSLQRHSPGSTPEPERISHSVRAKKNSPPDPGSHAAGSDVIYFHQ